MKLKVIALALLMSAPSFASHQVFCGNIKSIRTWGSGSDTYGIWVEYESNPASCSSGFYLQHNVENKNLVFSQLLTAKSIGANVCIQAYMEANIFNRCRLNTITHQVFNCYESPRKSYLATVLSQGIVL